MSDAAGTKSDGGLKFGSQIFTIKDDTGSDQAYIADAFDLKQPSNWMVRGNEKNVPAAQFGVKGVKTGTATLQFADDTTKKPAQFAEFAAVTAGGASVTLIVAEVGEGYKSDGEAKFTIEVREKLNP